MTLVRLHLTIPEGTWIADVSRAYPDATFRVLAAVPGREGGFMLVSVDSGDVGGVVEALTAHERVGGLEVIQCSGGEATVQFSVGRAPIMQAAKRSGLPIELPFRVTDGTATIDLLGSRDRLLEFGRQLETAGIDYEIESVDRRRHLDQLLTDVQRDLLCEAIERGYYDSPRRCTLTELAEAVGIAKSTCSETLQRAESSVMKRFFEEVPGDDWTEVSA